jgi:hypothetical protein
VPLSIYVHIKTIIAKQAVNIAWNANMAFNLNADGHQIIVDADEKVGGTEEI